MESRSQISTRSSLGKWRALSQSVPATGLTQ
ncbi:hypothetical protein PPTG_24833 [Phytophthora nicotianae INRA-310]|uniref:Uncharacterized protein n=1 Tax=Phytophthora nicotianae (strain INRA-310) TaxID=761204 RepID=W2PCQ3_PHYN3|nr:hypothetical protein PPTG_24833 [Phytophthora nicotianae INRA-310]ETM97774.1 hypothetical protein PPTG_24833 [Phytophthora nicotianae INRA-310]